MDKRLDQEAKMSPSAAAVSPSGKFCVGRLPGESRRSSPGYNPQPLRGRRKEQEQGPIEIEFHSSAKMNGCPLV
jgi:hypothetical protein